MDTLHILKLPHWPIFEQLQLEEALLRTDERNWCILNFGSPPAIVMGISGKEELLVKKNKQKEAAVPLIRRFSGGGCVVIDETTLFVTLLCNQKAVPIPPFPQQILNWTETLYSPLFKTPFQLRENDYVLENRKCGGNAQYILKNRWLHHTSFLWDYCPKKMELLKMPPKIPSYREKRDHHDFLCTLKEHFDSKEAFFEGLLKILANQFHLILTELSEATSCLKNAHRQATTWIE